LGKNYIELVYIYLFIVFKIKIKMSQQFWKPGTKKPCILKDEEGGVVFFAP
jgi:hypothetical protein